jgi:uncharacterized protein (TIGR04255 family)
MRWLLDTKPDPAPLPEHIAVLRYINSLPFDPAKQNVFEFLDKMLNTKVELPPKFFRNRGVSPSAAELNWQGTFQLTEFPGSVTVHFAIAKKDDLPVVIWGTVVQSTGDQIADLSLEFPAWLENAHSITEDWFFGMIEGELERRFENGSVSHFVHRAVPGNH